MPQINYSLELLKKLTPGKKVRFFYGENNPNNKLCHIRSIVDYEYIVYRTWLPHKKSWGYGVKWIYDFHVAFKMGDLRFK